MNAPLAVAGVAQSFLACFIAHRAIVDLGYPDRRGVLVFARLVGGFALAIFSGVMIALAILGAER